MGSPEGFVVGIPSLILTVTATIMAGTGWGAVYSKDMCFGAMGEFIYAVSISASVSLVAFGIGATVALASFVEPRLITMSLLYNGGVAIMFAMVSGGINIIWVLWGMVLVSQGRCRGTVYFQSGVLLVIGAAASLLGNWRIHAMSRRFKNKRNSDMAKNPSIVAEDGGVRDEGPSLEVPGRRLEGKSLSQGGLSRSRNHLKIKASSSVDITSSDAFSVERVERSKTGGSWININSANVGYHPFPPPPVIRIAESSAPQLPKG
ncbi:hypothetical protein DFS34DRAFT_648494 [Phlyctochytrium arcticum]|nr:hypothetical protein DFS34DRAFT_648494 [Phlyctochytrium arcticum]